MNLIILSLGSNVGNRIDNMNKAIEILSNKGIRIKQISSFYETEPWGVKEQAKFLNAVIKAETSLSPQELLLCIKSIESELGRKETFRWGPRMIDIDILFYDNQVINNDELTIPHPLIQDREFVLLPLVEILPDWIHPVLSKDIKTLLNELNGDNGNGKDY